MNSRRLENDYERLRLLCARSPAFVQIDRAVGRPPNAYYLTLRCRGVAGLGEAGPQYRGEHKVEIILGADYPFSPPGVTVTTPVFHPHIWANNRVCIGDWIGTEFLDLLVRRLFRILQYDPQYLDATSVANWEAQRWAAGHRSLFPLGTELVAEEPVVPRIRFTPTDL